MARTWLCGTGRKSADMHLETSVTIAMGHRLKDYAGACSNLHGHNWTVEMTFAPNHIPLPPSGMAVDFTELKAEVRDHLLGFDHSLLLQDSDPLAQILVDVYAQRVWAMNAPPTTE